MPPQQRNETVVDTRPISRVTSMSEMSVQSTASEGETPKSAREYRVRKSSLIG